MTTPRPDPRPAREPKAVGPIKSFPDWAQKCLLQDHHVTLDEKSDGSEEVFCSDCSRGESMERRPRAGGKRRRKA